MTTTQSPKEKNPASFFEDGMANAQVSHNAQLSPININEAEQEYVLYATATGLKREDLYVSVDKKVITIIAAGNEGEAYLKNQGRQNPTEQVRTITLPDNADPLLTSATYNNGSLEIHIPKGENTEEKPFMIHVY